MWKTNRAAADGFAANVLPIVRQIEAAGATNPWRDCRRPQCAGIRTARGRVALSLTRKLARWASALTTIDPPLLIGMDPLTCFLTTVSW